MMAIIAADELETASNTPRLISPASLLLEILIELIGDQFQSLRRQETAERSEHVVDERRDRKIAGQRDQEQQRREQRKEEVIRELRRQGEAVVLPERFIKRAPEDLSPREGHVERTKEHRHGQNACPILK